MAPPSASPAPSGPIDPPPAFVAAPPGALILDVDGVLTDNSITLDGEGGETKRFFVPDGTGIHLVRRAGVGLALVSGRSSPVVAARARELGIPHAHDGVPDKAPVVAALLEEMGVERDHAVYVGDDWVDLVAMREVGLPVAVANAIPEVRAAAVAVTTRPGGAGAVREVCEWILAARGEWERITGEVAG